MHQKKKQLELLLITTLGKSKLLPLLRSNTAEHNHFQ